MSYHTTSTNDRRTNAELYEARSNGDDVKVCEICRELPDGPFHILTIHGDSVLHIACYYKRNNLVLQLMNQLPQDQHNKLTIKNEAGNTLLHATATNKKTAGAASLLTMTDNLGETALFRAACYGKTKIFCFLEEQVSQESLTESDLRTFFFRDDKATILHVAIHSENFELALKIAETYPILIDERDGDGMTALQLLACKVASHQLSPVCLKMTISNASYTNVCNYVYKSSCFIRHVYRDQNEESFDEATRKIDKRGNSILHMVGLKVRDQKAESDTRSTALVLRDDLLLFERVKNICTTLTRLQVNNDGVTAEQLFIENNAQLRVEAKEWMKSTAENCSIVAVLIATVAFAAAYTVPGGPNQTTGYPLLKNQPFFIVFALADALSLTFSLTSVIIFLSILTCF